MQTTCVQNVNTHALAHAHTPRTPARAHTHTYVCTYRYFVKKNFRYRKGAHRQPRKNPDSDGCARTYYIYTCTTSGTRSSHQEYTDTARIPVCALHGGGAESDGYTDAFAPSDRSTTNILIYGTFDGNFVYIPYFTHSHIRSLNHSRSARLSSICGFAFSHPLIGYAHWTRGCLCVGACVCVCA